MASYPTTYIDNFGKEESFFVSDGTSLTIQLRNQLFVGQGFDSLGWQDTEKATNLDFSFTAQGFLTDCCFKVKFPIQVRRHAEMLHATLSIDMLLKHSEQPISSAFALTVNNHVFDLQDGHVREMWFEDQMIQLQTLLPQDLKMNACIFCAYSNYGVAGSDSFGTLHCFKDIKEEIVLVDNKSDYMDVAANKGVPTQETFWCPAFREIGKGQWQYKDTI
jgi:hypothetical protein